jgi:hypothetical protein
MANKFFSIIKTASSGTPAVPESTVVYLDTAAELSKVDRLIISKLLIMANH